MNVAKWRDRAVKAQLRLMGCDPERVIWQVGEFGADLKTGADGFLASEEPTPLWITEAVGYTDAVALAAKLTTEGKNVAYRPVMAEPLSNRPDPAALLHGRRPGVGVVTEPDGSTHGTLA